ncbi:MAG: S-layer homology domain-containing protein [Oscillibacter sp.]|nr:S-layer homology domain-containing protein [Oscillibacter sp.]
MTTTGSGDSTTTDSGENEPPADSGENEPPDNYEPSLPFTDVPREHWSFPYVLYAYEHNLVRGVSATEFNPTGVMTRAAFVAVLYRQSAAIEGADTSTGEAAFTDIGDINSEFQSAIRWGVKHGVVTGKDPGTFAPRENISRQQMCAIIVRYLRDYLRYDLSAYAVPSGFADYDTISKYAKEAVSICKAMGILDGREVDGVTIFDPAGSASRAAVVKVLSNAVQQIPGLRKLPEPVENPDTGNTSGNGGSTDSGDTIGNGGSTDSGDTIGNGGSTDSGDSANSDTGDTKKNTSSGSGSHSSGGSSSSSGGGSTYIPPTPSTPGTGDSGNTTPPTEPENAPEVFAIVDRILSAYEANPPESELAQNYMNLLLPPIREMREARNNGAIVDESYFRTHYDAELRAFLALYDQTSLPDLMELADYARTLASVQEWRTVLSYFGILNVLIG